MKTELIMIQPKDNAWYSLDNLPNEEWKDIQGYEGLYQVSNYGRVKSLQNNKIMKPGKSKSNNYRYHITLCKDGVHKSAKCHRLVAQAFVPNPDNLPEVNHKNPVTAEICDNRSTELEWATHSDNMQWRTKCGNHPKGTFIRNGINVNNKRVIQFNADDTYIRTFSSLRDAMRVTGIDETSISKVCHGKIKTAGGYKFILEEDYKKDE